MSEVGRQRHCKHSVKNPSVNLKTYIDTWFYWTVITRFPRAFKMAAQKMCVYLAIMDEVPSFVHEEVVCRSGLGNVKEFQALL